MFYTIQKFSELSGYTVKAIQTKIHEGTWLEGKVYKRAPDKRILIDEEGYADWVNSAAPKRLYPQRAASCAASPAKVSPISNLLRVKG